MTDSGLLIVFSGPSGAGKSTVLKRFLENNDRCVLSVSATTRAPRPGEESGRDYFFLSREEFGGYVARGDMLEYAEYSGNYYGTPREAVDRQLAAGKNVFLEIEVKGALQIKKIRPKAVLVFVMPPSWEVLVSRLTGRGTETEESIRLRLETAREELRQAAAYDYIVVNESVEDCCRQLGAVVSAAGYATAQMRDFIEEVCGNA